MPGSVSPPPPEQATKKLPPYLVVLFTAILPVGVLMFFTVCVGTFILADPENKYWISRTAFATIYRRYVLWNVATNMIAFNGSAYGCFYIYRKLMDHAQAVKQETPEVQAPPLSRQQRRQQEREVKREGKKVQ
eukprot:jgi/Botrbrau1/8905/Bobra.0148s0020.1